MNSNFKKITTGSLLAIAAAGFTPAAVYAMDAEEIAEQKAEARDTLQASAKVLKNMKADDDMSNVLNSAKGVFLVPNYGRAALGIGVEGGEGVLVVNKNGKWSGPLFYNVGALSVGLQAGIDAGEIAMVLQTDEAVNSFMQENNFSLNADAGLTILDWSARAQGSLGKGDIIMWSGTDGLFGDAAINVEDIMWDGEENAAYYGSKVTSDSVASGKTRDKGENPMLIVLTEDK